MFQSFFKSQKRKTNRSLVLLIIQIHILVLLLAGVLLARSCFQNRPASFFTILFGETPNSSSYDQRETKIQDSGSEE